MTAPKLLVFAGSTRTDSLNKKLARVVTDAAKAAGAEATYLDLRDLPMPLYDGDIEDRDGLPAHAKTFKQALRDAAGFLIVTPEYNSSIPAVLKNAIDWASRQEDDSEKALVAFQGKVAGILAASPGALGGLRSLVHLRQILGNIGVLVVPEQHALSRAGEAFDESGKLKDPKAQAAVEKVVKRAVEVARRLS